MSWRRKGIGSSVCAAHAAFLLDDDLGQHRMGQVVAGLGVENDEIPLGFHHRRQIVERDVGACLSIVEPPVGVLLDDHRLFLVGWRVRLLSMASVDRWIACHCAARTLARHCNARPAVFDCMPARPELTRRRLTLHCRLRSAACYRAAS